LFKDGSKRVREIRRHLTSASPGLMERLDKRLDNAIDAGEKICGIGAEASFPDLTPRPKKKNKKKKLKITANIYAQEGKKLSSRL